MIILANRRSRHRVGLVALALALLPSAATARKPPVPAAPVADRITSRMVVEKQINTRSPVAGSNMNSAESRRIQERYFSRIGAQLEVDDSSQSGRSK
jgi:hypothetical protein